LFHSVSQYPTPYFRGLAKLTQIHKTGVWGWSDHGEDIEVCKEAALHGATYIERHFSMPFAKRISAWDSDATSLRELRDFCDSVAWEGTKAHTDACDKFITRWSGQ
jgi:sialic acid synthase SpsE